MLVISLNSHLPFQKSLKKNQNPGVYQDESIILTPRVKKTSGVLHTAVKTFQGNLFAPYSIANIRQ